MSVRKIINAIVICASFQTWNFFFQVITHTHIDTHTKTHLEPTWNVKQCRMHYPNFLPFTETVFDSFSATQKNKPHKILLQQIFSALFSIFFITSIYTILTVLNTVWLKMCVLFFFQTFFYFVLFSCCEIVITHTHTNTNTHIQTLTPSHNDV